MTVGISVLTFNSAEVISDCLSSLLESSVPVSIVVVDNASSDNTLQIVRSRFPSVRIVPNQANVGYAQGNNLGALELISLGCETVFVVNPDVVVQRDTLGIMQRVLMESPENGCVGARQRDSARSFRNRPTYVEKLVLYGSFQMLPITNRVFARAVRRGRERHYPQFERNTQVYAVSGACWCFRARVLEGVGMLDQRTFLYEEEFIAAERLLKAGYRTIACTDAVYTHSGEHSIRDSPFQAFRFFVRSERILICIYSWSILHRSFLHAYRGLEIAYFRLIVVLKALLLRRQSRKGSRLSANSESHS